MQRRHHQVEGETKARAKNGVPLPPDGFSFANLFLEPLFPTVFYPPTFCLPPETEPHSSVCTLFYSYVFRFGLHSVLLFAVFLLIWEQFYKNVLCLIIGFYGLYRVSAVCFAWLCGWNWLYCPLYVSFFRQSLIFYQSCLQTDFVGKRSL